MNAMLRLLICLALAADAVSAESAKPNVVIIYADDIGYGDVHCMAPAHGKIPTPHLDKMASRGMIFGDAHSDATICTPSRYALLTGRHHWRANRQWATEFGPPVIPRDRLTLPQLLRQHGYATGIFGKWHLGLDWTPKPGAKNKKRLTAGDVDYASPIRNGPLTRGFDTWFGCDVPNWPPFCFIQDDRTVGIPTASLPDEMYDYYRLVSRRGPMAPGWKLEEILPTITDKACAFIRQQSAAKKPYFLYFSMTAPHTPISPTAEWKGKSGFGDYGDFIMQVDDTAGRVLAAIAESGAEANTLVIFTGDNGPSPHGGITRSDKGAIAEMEDKGHYSRARYRGYKGSVFEGGHRMPFIAQWPETISPGTRTDQLVGQVDLMATCAELLGVQLPPNVGEDSVSFLSLLKGDDSPIRKYLVQRSVRAFAIREDQWKLVFTSGTDGSWERPHRKPTPRNVQLFNLADDPGESTDLIDQYPERVAHLGAVLATIIANGRSTPGPNQPNNRTVKIPNASKKPIADTDY